MRRIATVRVAKAEKMIDKPKKPPPLREDKPRCMTMDQSTSDSSAHRPWEQSLHHKYTPGTVKYADLATYDVSLTCMGKAERPEAQVGSRVGNAAQTVLYGMDGLVDSYITKVKLWWEEQGFQHRNQHWIIVLLVFLRLWTSLTPSSCSGLSRSSQEIHLATVLTSGSTAACLTNPALHDQSSPVRLLRTSASCLRIVEKCRLSPHMFMFRCLTCSDHYWRSLKG